MASDDETDSRSRRRKKKKKDKRKRKERRKRSRSPERSSSDRHRARKESKKRKRSRQLIEGSSSQPKNVPSESGSTSKGIRKGAETEKEAPTPPPADSTTPSESSQHEVRRRSMIPMTQAQYEEQRSRITEVYDEASGRYRLVRGDGEILERIVSRQQHEQINRAATRSDGASFVRQMRQRTYR